MSATSRFLATTVLTAVALVDLPASAGPPGVVCVVIHDRAEVPMPVLRQAIQHVVDLYRPLGLGIVWTQSAAPLADLATLHLSMLPRPTGRGEAQGIVGIDAPAGTGAREYVAHVLYRRVGNHEVTSQALAYVIAHLIGAALRSSAGAPQATIVRADRHAAQLVAGGGQIFTTEELAAIQEGIALLAKTSR